MDRVLLTAVSVQIGDRVVLVANSTAADTDSHSLSFSDRVTGIYWLIANGGKSLCSFNRQNS